MMTNDAYLIFKARAPVPIRIRRIVIRIDVGHATVRVRTVIRTNETLEPGSGRYHLTIYFKDQSYYSETKKMKFRCHYFIIYLI